MSVTAVVFQQFMVPYVAVAAAASVKCAPTAVRILASSRVEVHAGQASQSHLLHMGSAGVAVTSTCCT
eukprot:CAMPEP_0183300242 /NCGR_PEP_ID=MMETSP0160_2-20130417/6740_1 /TAXON_ID=2839 ORGANISM="Odontella Sinensis, Strain Grunow 1884" /NCGR_SAMPLE_ID=MMETSP0160_2 /ASSEMBLY_ACC=CAM_ASM_000250 /LENGTH=67 /DNA_ID=CAMNT_0025462629 /DNA_START=80 /DNA_END=283 /DNA_ORIENTATION=-